MGYTHYWKHKRKEEVTDEQRKRMADFAHNAIKLCNVPIADGWGEGGDPVLTEKSIRFTGNGHDAHETFSLLDTEGFQFCKTARKPYDTVVVACLTYAQEIGLFTEAWSSDGDEEDHQDGLALYDEVMKEMTQYDEA